MVNYYINGKQRNITPFIYHHNNNKHLIGHFENSTHLIISFDVRGLRYSEISYPLGVLQILCKALGKRFSQVIQW